MILTANENDLNIGRNFPFEVLCERHPAESASHYNYPSFTHRSTSVLSGSVVLAQSFFKFGLCSPITEQRLLVLVIGFGKGCLRFQDIGHERCSKLVPVRIDTQSLERRLLRKLSDDQSLAGLLELAELVAYIDQDAALCLVQTPPCLLDGLAFFRQLVSFSSPVEDLPRDRKAGAREIFRDEVVEIPKRHIKEAGAHIGNVLGLFDTTVYFGLLDLESRLSYFGSLLQRTISRALQIGRKTTHIRYRVQAEISAHITAEQVVELFLFCGKVIREIDRLILCFGQARFYLKACIL